MSRRAQKILIVEPDSELLEMLVESLIARFNPQITCVSEPRDAIDVELTEPHDLVILEAQFPGAQTLGLAQVLAELHDRPIIALADHLTTDDAIHAIRLGIHDVFTKPFAIEHLLRASQKALYSYRAKRSARIRNHQVRSLLRTTIRDRRLLNNRIDLVCRDLVHAHRRLLMKVLEMPAQPVLGDA